MKLKLALVIITVIMALPLLSCSVSKNNSVFIGDSGKEVTIATGDTLTLTLFSDTLTSGWKEDVKIGDNTVLKQVSFKPRVSGNLAQTWKFKAVKTGTTSLSTEYFSVTDTSSEKQELTQTFNLNVVVK